MGRSVSVVIPAYNEALRLPKTLETIAAYAGSGRCTIEEVVVVDDGSRDATAELARRGVTGLDVPMPYARNLEKLVLPSAENILKAARQISYIV